MLRSAEDVHLLFDPDLPDLNGDGWLVVQADGDEIRVGRSSYREFVRVLDASASAPHEVGVVGSVALWTFRGEYLYIDEELTVEEIRQEFAWRLARA